MCQHNISFLITGLVGVMHSLAHFHPSISITPSPSQSPHFTNLPHHLTNPTTVVWKVTPLFASWLSSSTNILATSSLLTPSSTILELGAGVSGIVALALGPTVSKYTATDQSYVLKLLRQNIADNLATVFPKPKKTGRGKSVEIGKGRIETVELDWETSDVSQLQDVDIVVACDCIYNEALIEPLNGTCAAICRLRQKRDQENGSRRPTLCLIAQQLRSPDVFEAWLKSFHDKFEVWKVPDEMLDHELREGSGFVVHVGIVR
jgi:hypothetical protein